MPTHRRARCRRCPTHGDGPRRTRVCAAHTAHAAGSIEHHRRRRHPEAHLTARITPWAAQPLPEAHARLRAVDVGALWAEAPRTRLSGQLDVTRAADGDAGWRVLAELSNRHAGPWDQRRLPVEQLHADVTWQDQVATVQALKAQVGGGTVESSGAGPHRPGHPPPHHRPTPAAATGQWQIDTRISGVNPARLHQMAAFPVDGAARCRAWAARSTSMPACRRAARADAPARSGESTAQALARDLRASPCATPWRLAAGTPAC